MRRFSSYGPVDTDMHYYAPRKKLIQKAQAQLIGDNPEKGGDYITVWGPRQTGKTWSMNNILFRLENDDRFHVLKIELEHLKTETHIPTVLNSIGKWIAKKLALPFYNNGKKIDTPEAFQSVFEKSVLTKPLILMLDEFDALPEDVISAIVGVFRNIHNIRQSQRDKATGDKDYLLHSVALIGVRSVLGVENAHGSPFNVQRSLHIPNLTCDETLSMFKWHEKESGQQVDQEAIDRLFYETAGQPGLTCWFGELLTEGWEKFPVTPDIPLDMGLFQRAYAAATSILPNNAILNMISKAKKTPFRETLLELFGTKEKIPFKYDNETINFLYMHGIIDSQEQGETTHYIKFSCPFIQKRLFAYFSDDIFQRIDRLYDPFEDLDDAITPHSLDIKNIIKHYRAYLSENKELVLKNAPRRSDMRVYEAMFHFNLYMYLSSFMKRFGGEVYPEFPAGNGKIDLIVKYGGRAYGIELKSYSNKAGYSHALKQAASYGKNLKLNEISLVFFVEAITDENREKYEALFYDSVANVTVTPIFVETGNLA